MPAPEPGDRVRLIADFYDDEDGPTPEWGAAGEVGTVVDVEHEPEPGQPAIASVAGVGKGAGPYWHLLSNLERLP